MRAGNFPKGSETEMPRGKRQWREEYELRRENGWSTLCIYVPLAMHADFKSAAAKRRLSLSEFIRQAALEKIRRTKKAA
jgi:hypothetical protein